MEDAYKMIEIQDIQVHEELPAKMDFIKLGDIAELDTMGAVSIIMARATIENAEVMRVIEATYKMKAGYTLVIWSSDNNHYTAVLLNSPYEVVKKSFTDFYELLKERDKNSDAALHGNDRDKFRKGENSFD